MVKERIGEGEKRAIGWQKGREGRPFVSNYRRKSEELPLFWLEKGSAESKKKVRKARVGCLWKGLAWGKP